MLSHLFIHSCVCKYPNLACTPCYLHETEKTVKYFWPKICNRFAELMLCDHISSILMAVARKIAGGLSNSMETPLRAQFLASSGQSRSGHMAPDQITAKFFIEHKSLRVQENPLQICHNCEHFQMQTIQTEMQRGSVSQAKKYWIWGSIVEIPLLIHKKHQYFIFWYLMERMSPVFNPTHAEAVWFPWFYWFYRFHQFARIFFVWLFEPVSPGQ